jgi:hypothetical protein
MAKQVPAKNGGTLTRPDPGESMNPAGKPKGILNRSTIARKVLEMTAIYPEQVLAKLKEMYPSIESSTSIEEMMTIVQADKAIRKRDTQAYEKLLDSAHGKPIASNDITSGGQKIQNIIVNITSDDDKSDPM